MVTSLLGHPVLSHLSENILAHVRSTTGVATGKLSYYYISVWNYSNSSEKGTCKERTWNAFNISFTTCKTINIHVTSNSSALIFLITCLYVTKMQSFHINLNDKCILQSFHVNLNDKIHFAIIIKALHLPNKIDQHVHQIDTKRQQVHLKHIKKISLHYRKPGRKLDTAWQ